MKKNIHIPYFLRIADITSIYKNRGDKNNLDNDRGIFGLSKIRNIFVSLKQVIQLIRDQIVGYDTINDTECYKSETQIVPM